MGHGGGEGGMNEAETTRREAKVFARILVPVDLSDRNARPLKMALALARQARASVTLFHVVQQVPRLAPGEMRTFYERLVRVSRQKLSRAARGFATRGIAARCEVCVGEPAQEIVRAAARGRASLIVMGSHRVDPKRRGGGWGTTSYKVGILCRCPVLLVK
jgi:nucleotide-binding universal stress UspA family protein